MKKLLEGTVANRGKAAGIVRIIDMDMGYGLEELEKVKEGDVIVTVMTRPDFMFAIRKASAIVTDIGGMLCHAAIVSREFDIPCIVNTKEATRILKDGMKVVVDANSGVVYEA